MSGTVTLDGQPMEKGCISFTPEDDQAGTAGSDIEAGRFQIPQLKPGKYRVQIVGLPNGPVIAPGSKEAMRTLSDQEVRAMMNPLPPDVLGNDRLIEIQAGAQTHHFPLESPTRP